jgi:hypothetical protein
MRFALRMFTTQGQKPPFGFVWSGESPRASLLRDQSMPVNAFGFSLARRWPPEPTPS